MSKKNESSPTGRTPSNKLNIQNVPIRKDEAERIREMFVPKEDCVFVDLDYSALEERVLSAFLKERGPGRGRGN